MAAPTKPALGTRAVLRPLTAYNGLRKCAGCDDPLSYVGGIKRTTARNKQIICNVYRHTPSQSVWDRTEHWHEECYDDAGKPHGPVLD